MAREEQEGVPFRRAEACCERESNHGGDGERRGEGLSREPSFAAINERSRRRRGAINFPRLLALRLINIIRRRDRSVTFFTHGARTHACTQALTRYARRLHGRWSAPAAKRILAKFVIPFYRPADAISQRLPRRRESKVYGVRVPHLPVSF